MKKGIAMMALLAILTVTPANASVLAKVKAGAGKAIDVLVKKPCVTASKVITNLVTHVGSAVYTTADEIEQFIID